MISEQKTLQWQYQLPMLASPAVDDAYRPGKRKTRSPFRHDTRMPFDTSKRRHVNGHSFFSFPFSFSFIGLRLLPGNLFFSFLPFLFLYRIADTARRGMGECSFFFFRWIAASARHPGLVASRRGAGGERGLVSFFSFFRWIADVAQHLGLVACAAGGRGQGLTQPLAPYDPLPRVRLRTHYFQ